MFLPNDWTEFLRYFRYLDISKRKKTLYEYLSLASFLSFMNIVQKHNTEDLLFDKNEHVSLCHLYKEENKKNSDSSICECNFYIRNPELYLERKFNIRKTDFSKLAIRFEHCSGTTHAEVENFNCCFKVNIDILRYYRDMDISKRIDEFHRYIWAARYLNFMNVVKKCKIDDKLYLTYNEFGKEVHLSICPWSIKDAVEGPDTCICNFFVCKPELYLHKKFGIKENNDLTCDTRLIIRFEKNCDTCNRVLESGDFCIPCYRLEEARRNIEKL